MRTKTNEKKNFKEIIFVFDDGKTLKISVDFSKNYANIMKEIMDILFEKNKNGDMFYLFENLQNPNEEGLITDEIIDLSKVIAVIFEREDLNVANNISDENKNTIIILKNKIIKTNISNIDELEKASSEGKPLEISKVILTPSMETWIIIDTDERILIKKDYFYAMSIHKQQK